MFYTGGVKHEVIRSEELEICDEVFEGSASVILVSKNSVAESGIKDRFFSLLDFMCVFCSWSALVQQVGLKRKERNLESVTEIFEFVRICVCV